jgi:hypothetical protein
VFETSAGSCIDSQPNDPAQNDVACRRRNTSSDNLSGNGNLLRQVSRLLKGRNELFVLFDGQGAGLTHPMPLLV